MQGARADVGIGRQAVGGSRWRTALLLGAAAAALAAGSAFALGQRVRSSRIEEQMLHAAAYTSGRGRIARAPQLWTRPFSARPRVGLQVGHWRMDELPDELFRLRDNTGTAWGPYSEVEVNLAVAKRAAEILRSQGVDVDLLPGTVPPDYLADAVVAIHADGAWRPEARGWKVATAWRASEASRRLERAIAAAYPEATGLPEDKVGITYGMKGYYAFSRQRFRHAISPFTPAVIIETGFLTDAADRAVLVGRTGEVAAGIASGVMTYLASHASLDWKSLEPRYYPLQQVGQIAAEVYAFPGVDAPVRDVLNPGTQVFPVNRQGDWVEIIVRGNFRSFGWMRESQLAPI